MSDLPQTGFEYVVDARKAERTLDNLSSDLLSLDRAFDQAAAESKAFDSALNGITDSVDTKVNVDTSDSEKLNEVSDRLGSLTDIAAIDLAMNIAGNVWDFLNRFERFTGVKAILEMDTAIAQLDAATGNAIPNAEELITKLWLEGWGESRTQLAGVLQEANNLGIANDDLYEAAQSALQIQSIWGKDTNETLRAADTMVKNNLAPDFETAMDIIATGLQTGADRGDDLLDTFNEYGSTFKQLNITGTEALGLINSGLAAGVDNSDRIADSLRETGIRLNEMANNPAIQEAFTQLDELTNIDLAGKLDAWQAGEITGGQFFEAFFQSLQDAAVADPTKAATLAATLVGTIAEDFGVESISQLTPVWDETMGVLNDRTDIAGATISNTLQTQLETAFRWVEQEAVKFLSSEQIDLPGKIDAIKQGLTEAMAALAGGADLATAVEIGFDIPGFADAVHRFEASIGEFAIGILELIAGVQDFLGKDSTGTRSQIAQMAEGQLAFNLKVANADEIQGEINRAVMRGVEPEAITEAVGTATSQLIGEGQVAQAQMLIDQLQIPELVIGNNLSDNDIVAAATALHNFREGAATLADLQPLIDSGAILSVGIDATQFQDEIDVAVKAGQSRFDAAVQSGDFSLAKSIADDLGDSGALFEQAFNDALASGNFDIAESIVENSGTINPAAVIVVDAFREQARAARRAAFEELGGFEDAGAEGGAAGKQSFISPMDTTPIDPAVLDQMKAGKDMADLLGETTAAVRLSTETDVNAMATAVESADQRIATAMTGNTMTASFQAVGQVANQVMPGVAAVFAKSVSQIIALDRQWTSETNILKGALLGLLGSVSKGLIDLATNLGNIAKNATLATQTTAGLTKADENAEGGSFRGLSWVGERGPELVFSDQKLNVLNNRSSEAMMAGFNMGAGMAAGNTTVNNITINQSNMLPSGAAIGNQNFNVGRQVRGL